MFDVVLDAVQANLTQGFFFRLEVVVEAPLLDSHSLGDVFGAGTMEAFLGKYRRGGAYSRLALLFVFVSAGTGHVDLSRLVLDGFYRVIEYRSTVTKN